MWEERIDGDDSVHVLSPPIFIPLSWQESFDMLIDGDAISDGIVGLRASHSDNC